MALGDYSGTVVTVLVTLFASFIAVQSLLDILGRAEIWLILVFLALVYLVFLYNFLDVGIYEKNISKRTQRQIIILQFINFLQLVTLSVLIQLFMYFFRYGMAVLHMTWFEYMILFIIIIFVVFVIFRKDRESLARWRKQKTA